MTRRETLAFGFAAALAGCKAKTAEKRYDMDGVVRGLDPSNKIATIQHGPIGDWMEAMTMEYKVKPDAEYQKLKVGDHIRAKVVVTDDAYYVTDVTVSR